MSEVLLCAHQFAALSTERDRFAREAEDANIELKEVQTQHQLIKIERDNLFEQNHQAKEKLGEGKKKLDIMKDREHRIIKTTENETCIIRDCTNHSRTVRFVFLQNLRTCGLAFRT